MSQGSLTFEERKVLTVSALTRAVKRTLEKDWAGVWVKGEVGNLRVPSSGHTYFNLKDDDACLKVVLWRNDSRRLKFTVKEGMELLVRGRLTVYEQKGEYQMVAEAIEPVGAGALQLAFEELKKKLAAEGLFDPQRKKALPYLARTIGVVTSPTGAALRDILAVMRRRAPGVQVVLAPVKVQGAGAGPDIAEAIRRMDKKGRVDVMILARGGGSVEDLWVFNEEPIARALSSCVTPTISAVGHEIDVTIADYVADRRAPTPSAAAEIACPDHRELSGRVREIVARLGGAERRRLDRFRRGVEDLKRRLKDPRRVIEEERLGIDDLSERLALAARRALSSRRAEVVGVRRALFAAGPLARTAHERQRFEKVRAALARAEEKALSARHARLGELAARLDSISPLAVLKRGYALVRDEASGAVVKRAADVREGQGLAIRLMEGEIGVTVKKKE